jgi:SAM-dependent methyltransferase
MDRARRRLLPVFALLGAVLLFAMEPMLARRLAALHGAGYQVWNASMMYYSGALLVGYLYAHGLAPRLGRGHLAVIGAALVWVALEPPWTPMPGGPTAAVLLALVRHSALPFVVLSSTGVIAQQWLAASRDPEGRDPYFLYAASNAGSLVGLVSYPLVVEPLLGLAAQRVAWIALFVAYALLAAWLVPRRGEWADVSASALPASPAGDASDEPFARPAPAYWLLLSAAPSMALLAVTNLIVNEIGSVPLAWVAPLAVYLSTFMLAFRRSPTTGSFARRFRAEFVAALCIAATGRLAIPLLLFFGVALAAHSELYRVRPPAEGLTRFYLFVALGGWVGSAFVSLAAPVLFDELYEWPLALLLAAGALFVGRRRIPQPVPAADAQRLRLFRAVAFAAAAGAIVNFAARDAVEGSLARVRNYYGIYRVTERVAGSAVVPGADTHRARYLIHGDTVHGVQLIDGAGPHPPGGYYHRATPLGEVLGSLPRPQRAAAVGLGAGAVAAYFGAGDELVFYELDDQGEGIARAWFDYLAESHAALSVVAGDARISLANGARAPDGSFDLIFVDAFSGDAVPAHLLTREALELYLRKLRPDGLLLFHISSRLYDFAPVLCASGGALGLHGVYKESDGPLEPLEFSTRAYALARDPHRLDALLANGWTPDREIRPTTLWTDDYVNVLAPLVRQRFPR